MPVGQKERGEDPDHVKGVVAQHACLSGGTSSDCGCVVLCRVALRCVHMYLVSTEQQ